MKKPSLLILITPLLFIVALPVSAVEKSKSFGYNIVPLFSLGLTQGGDKIIEGGDNTLGSDIRAGGLISVASGLQLTFPAYNMMLRGTVGIQADSLLTQISTYSFDRKNVELLFYSGWPRHQFGGGLTYHINPTFKSSLLVLGAGSNDIGRFDDSLGWVVEYLYRPWDQINFSLRHVTIEYATGGNIRPVLDGSHSGMSISYLF